MAFSPEFLDEIRLRVQPSDFIGHRVALTRNGSEFSGLCPFHKEKTPSFKVSDEKGFFHCFGCGAHGDVIAFDMRMDGLDFIKAVERLAGVAGLTLPKAEGGPLQTISGLPPHSDEQGREQASQDHSAGEVTTPKRPPPLSGELTDKMVAWFGERGISRATLDAAKVTSTRAWMPKPNCEVDCAAFPYFRDGETINIKFRGPQKTFRQHKGAEKIFYGLDTIRDHKTIIIVEGEIDALSLHEAGLLANYAILSVPDGAPGKVREAEINPETDAKFSYVWNCHDALETAKRVILAVDADEAGQALEEELARRIGKEKCWRVKWPNANDVQVKDANEALVECGSQVVRECIKAAKPYPIASLYGADHYDADVMRLFREGRARGLSTGFSSLDGLLSVVPGLLYVVTGYPSSGKSEVVDAIAVNLAMSHEQRWALCSFENSPEEHILKLAEKKLSMPAWEGMGATRMGEGDLRYAMAWINEHFTFIRAEDESPTIDWVLEKARVAVMRYGINGLVLDPYNEFEHSRPRSVSETEYIGAMLAKVKRFAQSHGVHVWFVAHPAKPEKMDKQKTAPSLMSISGSANWVGKADFGISIYRPWHEDGTRSSECEIHVKKSRHRHLGRAGVAHLHFNPATGRYEE